ncbi:hypothetical protein KXQ82_09180 [Mucilaginibacter sp. HMF5004]|uniref:hypothetical protein n=1 Tax=Mucilaginibacter rivuli TaxID=2857527 RepID=UPI001C6036F6|nr:hypothetical protein [Mucilaginibacter rivuli]MBW4889888.1 hypothetical protein [Mucilaginibacter rivuli]
MSTVKIKKALLVEVALIRVLSIAFQLVFLKLYTYNTSIYELGTYYFLFTVSYCINAFLLIPLDYFQQSNIYKLKEGNYSLQSFNAINLTVLKLLFLLLTASCLLSIVFFPKYFILIVIIILLSISTYFVTLIRGFINNLELRRQATYCLLLENCAKIAVFFLLNKMAGHSSALMILQSLLFSSLIAFATLYVILRRIPEYNTGAIYKFDIKETFKFSYPMTFNAVINMLQTQGYRLILVPLGLTEVVGIYATVANVGISGTNAYSTVFGQIFVPGLYKTHGKYILTYLRNALLSLIVIMLGGYLFSNLVIRIITKSMLVKYSSLILYGIMTEGGNFLAGALIIYLTIKGKTYFTIRASTLGIVVLMISFGLLYFFKILNVYTIGIPIALSQVCITSYFFIIVYKLTAKSTNHE